MIELYTPMSLSKTIWNMLKLLSKAPILRIYCIPLMVISVFLFGQSRYGSRAVTENGNKEIKETQNSSKRKIKVEASN